MYEDHVVLVTWYASYVCTRMCASTLAWVDRYIGRVVQLCVRAASQDTNLAQLYRAVCVHAMSATPTALALQRSCIFTCQGQRRSLGRRSSTVRYAYENTKLHCCIPGGGLIFTNFSHTPDEC